jgi:hypothetical protein
MGRLFNTNGAVIVDTTIYLARVYKSNDQTKGVFALDPTRAPKTTSQKDGRFIFSDIELGDYVLIVGNPDGGKSAAIYSNAQGQANVFMVKTGEITNLGDLHVAY